MAPTKVLKNGHGIHLSSPPASIGMDLDGTVMQNLQLESQMKSTEDGEPLSTIAKRFVYCMDTVLLLSVGHMVLMCITPLFPLPVCPLHILTGRLA